MSKAEAVTSITSLSSEGSFLSNLATFLGPFGKVSGALGDLIGLLPKA